MIKHIILGFMLLHTSTTLFGSAQDMVHAAHAGISAATILSNLKNNKPSTSAKGPHPCLHCPKIFTKPSSVALHQKVHQPKVRHTCKRCNASYINHDLLVNHQNGIGKQVPCPAIKKALAPLLAAVIAAAQADQ